jgi:hypothetical protein
MPIHASESPQTGDIPIISSLHPWLTVSSSSSQCPHSSGLWYTIGVRGQLRYIMKIDTRPGITMDECHMQMCDYTTHTPQNQKRYSSTLIQSTTLDGTIWDA